jgi:hypothetical protein
MTKKAKENNKTASAIFGILKDKPREFRGTLSIEEMEEVIDREQLKDGLGGLVQEESEKKLRCRKRIDQG